MEPGTSLGRVQECGCIALAPEVQEQTGLYPGATFRVELTAYKPRAAHPDRNKISLRTQAAGSLRLNPAFDDLARQTAKTAYCSLVRCG